MKLLLIEFVLQKFENLKKRKRKTKN